VAENPINVLSLFSGIGGLDLAGRRGEVRREGVGRPPGRRWRNDDHDTGADPAMG
jgi:hypothetical protein